MNKGGDQTGTVFCLKCEWWFYMDGMWFDFEDNSKRVIPQLHFGKRMLLLWVVTLESKNVLVYLEFSYITLKVQQHKV